MQANYLQTLYPRFQSVLGALPDNTSSLCLHSSEDRVCFDAYPQQTFVFPTNMVTNVPQELKTLFALQVTGLIIQAAIESATMLQHELDIGCGYSVRIVDSAADLAYVADCCQTTSAFVRADASLWVWADSVDVVFSCWSDVARYLQSRFQSSLLHSNPMAGLSGYGYSDSLSFDQHLQADHFDFSSGFLQAEGSSQPSADTLSSLNEFSFLATVHNPTPSPTLASASNGTNLYADPAWPWGQSESPDMGVLQLALQTLDTSESPANDVPSFNFGNTSLTVNLASISPPPVGVFDLSQEEDTTATASSCGTSLGFSTPASDGAISPASFSFSPSARQQQNPLELSTDAAGPFSFRRHSIGATSAPPPREVGMKRSATVTTTTIIDTPSITSTARFSPPPQTAHTSKRMRADGGAIVKATSAPARFTVPLPNVEKNDCDDDDDGGVSGPGQSLAPFTPATASTSTAPLPSPVPRPHQLQLQLQLHAAHGVARVQAPAGAGGAPRAPGARNASSVRGRSRARRTRSGTRSRRARRTRTRRACGAPSAARCSRGWTRRSGIGAGTRTRSARRPSGLTRLGPDALLRPARRCCVELRDGWGSCAFT
ncbi:hypothetical protein EDB92DRAFT_653780 [Lactarius akahatsu]|uniref:DUF7928 domain-containing protein n=1 Tax=Lactarius akahatsu TaxID=416441 RepID=A0AAD4Q4X3_9AGAM|nr:hypothetical protein EDB92DRAFT_653780 [Lactarius akahatsu]